MDLSNLKDTPPWDWPEDTANRLLEILRNRDANQTDRKLAADLAGTSTVINDDIGSALLSIVCSSDEAQDTRATAAIALGPALGQADSLGFEDPDDILLSEQAVRHIEESLRKLYLDAAVPDEVWRSILEVAVRAPQDWSRDAVRAAYASADEAWTLTAVFGMRFVPGFEDQILEALTSLNQDIYYQAVCAAGNWEIDAAWPQIETILRADSVEKPLLLAAIESAVSIRPRAAVGLLTELTDSEDEDIADAAFEALAMAEDPLAFDDEDEDDLDRW